jgi:hypothetical protein
MENNNQQNKQKNSSFWSIFNLLLVLLLMGWSAWEHNIDATIAWMCVLFLELRIKKYE